MAKKGVSEFHEKWLTLRDIQRHLAERKIALIEQYEADGQEPPFEVLYGDGRKPQNYPPPEVWLAQRYEKNALSGRVTSRRYNVAIEYPPPNARPPDFMGEPEPETEACKAPWPQPMLPPGVVAEKRHGRKIAVPDPTRISERQRAEFIEALVVEEKYHLQASEHAADLGDEQRSMVASWLAEETRVDILRMQTAGDIWTAIIRVAQETDPAILAVEEHVQKMDAALQGAIKTIAQIMHHNQAPQYGPYPGASPLVGPVGHPPDYQSPPQPAQARGYDQYGPIPPPVPRR